MGLSRIVVAGPRRRTWRMAVVAGVLLSSLLVAGCKEVQDIREELGWAKPNELPPAPVVASLETHWVPADAAVADVSQAQWSARWWQWAGRFPGVNELPYRDPDGRRCAQYQEGPVWFLAGTDGNFDAVRSCRIPAGKHLFVPLITWVANRGLQGVPMSCAEKQAHARRLADHVVSGLVLLDGRPVGELQRMRVASGACFDGAPGDLPAASDGYWLMLKPLPPGQHQLAIAAAFRDGPRQMLQNFRYELEVEGEPAEVAGAVQ